MVKKLMRVAIAVLLILVFVVGCAQTGTTTPSASGAPVSASTAPASTEPSAAPSASASTVDQSKTEIVIGAVRSQTGVFALFDQTAFGPCYRMWVDKVNEGWRHFCQGV